MSKDIIEGKMPVGSGTPIVSRDECFEMINNIQGKMLTVIDASIGEMKQREAVKSLIRMSLNDIRDIVNNRWAKISEFEEKDGQGTLQPWLFTPTSTVGSSIY